MKLENGPYQVTLVGDGQAALERVAGDEPIDVVLLDIMMPHLSGLEVLARIREMPHRAEVPVIILTAKGQDSDRARRWSWAQPTSSPSHSAPGSC
jgi:CheY-like chemotaxis protein